MSSCKYKTFVLAFIFIPQFVFAAVPSPADFPFERKILMSQRIKGMADVKVILDPFVLRQVNERFSNFNLVNSRNEEVAYSLFSTPFDQIMDLEVLDFSSRKEEIPENLIDNSVLTSFSFDKRKDGRDGSWVLIDLGETQSINRLNFFPKHRAKIKQVEIMTGQDSEDLKVISAKRPFKRFIDVRSSLIRYIKVTFWGISIKMDDIRIVADGRVAVYFEAKEGESYKILYGGPEVNLIRYKAKSDEAKEGDFILANLSKEVQNSLFPKDYDGDGINNDHDNCPFIPNPPQEDFDADRVGNICDNALKVRNSRQFDTDNDGVGDIIDNCKLEWNPLQGDIDGDDFGDACDSAYAVESDDKGKLSEKSLPFHIGLIIVALFLFYVLQRQMRKKN